MKDVAVFASNCTPSPQSSVTVFASAEVRMMDGTVLLETVKFDAPQSFSLLLPVMLIEAIVPVPLSWSFKPPSTFLNLRFMSLVELVTAVIGNAPLPKLSRAYV